MGRTADCGLCTAYRAQQPPCSYPDPFVWWHEEWVGGAPDVEAAIAHVHSRACRGTRCCAPRALRACAWGPKGGDCCVNTCSLICDHKRKLETASAITATITIHNLDRCRRALPFIIEARWWRVERDGGVGGVGGTIIKQPNTVLRCSPLVHACLVCPTRRCAVVKGSWHNVRPDAG